MLPYALEDLLEPRTRDLFAEVNAMRPVRLAPGSNTGWECVVTDASVDIRVGQTTRPAALFVHELLHARLHLQGFRFVVTYQSSTTLEFIDDLPNTYAHFKIFPDFLALDFDHHEFLHESDDTAPTKRLKAAVRDLRRTHPGGGAPPGKIAAAYLSAHSPPGPTGADREQLKRLQRLAEPGAFASLASLVDRLRNSTSDDVPELYARFYGLCGRSDAIFKSSIDADDIYNSADFV